MDGEISIRHLRVCNYVQAGDLQLVQTMVLPQACYPQVSSLGPHGSRESFHKPRLISGGDERAVPVEAQFKISKQIFEMTPFVKTLLSLRYLNLNRLFGIKVSVNDRRRVPG